MYLYTYIYVFILGIEKSDKSLEMLYRFFSHLKSLTLPLYNFLNIIDCQKRERKRNKNNSNNNEITD